MRVAHGSLTLLARYRTKFRGFLGKPTDPHTHTVDFHMKTPCQGAYAWNCIHALN